MSSSNRYIVVQFYTLMIHALPCTDPLPVNLSQIVSANTESSAVVQWQPPEETVGRGINISNYTVTVSNSTGHQIMSESVTDDGREWHLLLQHHWTGL